MKIKIDGVGKYLQEFEYSSGITNEGNFVITVIYPFITPDKSKMKKSITYLLIPDQSHSIGYMGKIFAEINEKKCDFKLSKDRLRFNTIYLNSKVHSGAFTGFVIK